MKRLIAGAAVLAAIWTAPLIFSAAPAYAADKLIISSWGGSWKDLIAETVDAFNNAADSGSEKLFASYQASGNQGDISTVRDFLCRIRLWSKVSVGRVTCMVLSSAK